MRCGAVRGQGPEQDDPHGVHSILGPGHLDLGARDLGPRAGAIKIHMRGHDLLCSAAMFNVYA